MKYALRILMIISFRLNKIGVVISDFALVALMILTVYAVFTRYVLERPSVHALEVSQYLLLVTSWMSMGWVLLIGRHVRMEAFYNIFPDFLKKISDITVKFSILLFCGVIFWAGSVNVITALDRGYRSSSLLSFPMWIPYGLIPIGGILLFLSVIYISLKDREQG